MVFRKKSVGKKNVGKINLRRRRVVRKVSTKISRPIKSYVNRMVRRNEETKYSSNQYGLTAFNSGINSAADLITLLPQITVGTGQNNRIGNKIRPVRMEVTGYFVYYTNSASSYSDARLLGARLFCFQDKTSKAYSNAIANYQILNLGGSSNNFTGTALNWVSPHNSEQFKFFYDKRMKILKPFGLTNNTTPSATNAITGMDSSLFHPFKIVLTQKDLPAVLQYDQTDDLAYPVNFSPYLALGYCDLLNTSADTTTTQIAMEFNCTLYYKDA